MNFRRKIALIIVALTVAVAISPYRNASAQERATTIDHAPVLAPFLADDTVAVAFVDLESIDPPALLQKLAPALKLPEPIMQQAGLGAAAAKGVIDALRASGIGRVYVVVGMGDVQRMAGPLILTRTADVRAADTLRNTLSQFGMLGRPASNPDAEMRLERHSGGTIMFSSKATVDRYALLLSTPRPDLIGPLNRASADRAAAAAVVIPDADSRRVVRELWLSPPPPFEKLTGSLIADRFKKLQFTINLAPAPTARLLVETTDDDAAATYRALLGEAQRAAVQIPNAKAVELASTIGKELEVQNDGPRLDIKLPIDKTLASAGGMIVKAVEAARESARVSQRMQKMSNMMKGVFTYESANRSLPPAAIRDAEGKPLLSWRVNILQWMDGESKALYNQFRLNEPWDSPHNLTLLKRMPAAFADPDPKLAALARDGKTTFQVPVGPLTIFFKNEGTRLSEITDGTSTTIALVEVVPERAVEWTKPADWEVNMQNPLDGVRRIDREGFAAARCDGSVSFYKNDMAAAIFRALLTRAGKEVINP